MSHLENDLPCNVFDNFKLDNGSAGLCDQQQELNKLKQFCSGEFLAHQVAYRAAKDITSYPALIIEEDASFREYNFTRLQTHNKGIAAYIAIPTKVTDQEQNQNIDIKVVFRGTKSRSSLLRDLEFGGAGSASFAVDRDKIISYINAAIEKINSRSNKPKLISITVAGHSLGGADAQNCVTALAQAISENYGYSVEQKNSIPQEFRTQFGYIKQIKLLTYNSAGVTKDIAEHSIKLAAFLANKREKMKTPVKLQAFYQLVGGDGIQQTGEANIFNNVPKEHVEVHVLKAHIGYEHHSFRLVEIAAATLAAGMLVAPLGATVIGSSLILASLIIGTIDTLKSHTEILFKKEPNIEPLQVSYQSISNVNPMGQKLIETELNKKSYSLWYAHKISSCFYNSITFLGNFAINSLKKTTKTTANATDNILDYTDAIKINVPKLKFKH